MTNLLKLFAMNKKSFLVALLFLLLTLALFGFAIYCSVKRVTHITLFDYLLAIVFVAAGVGMVYNEYKKKRRRHIEEAGTERR